MDGKCGGEAAACHQCTNNTCAACKQCEGCAFGDSATADANCSFPLLYDSCGDHSHDPQGFYIQEDYSPFANPPELLEPCPCFNFSSGNYDCVTVSGITADDDASARTAPYPLSSSRGK